MEPAVTMITCWNGSEAESEDACPTKITCWDGSFTTSEAACPVEVTTVTCWDGSTADTSEACPVQPAPEPEPMPVVEPEPVETIRNTTTALGAASIFMPGAAEAVRVSRLGTNPEFGDSHALTPSGFYDKLANRYATNEYDRQYLDFLFKELGYAGGFKDVTAAAFTNDTVQNGVRGILGYSPAHAYQYSEFNVTLELFSCAFAGRFGFRGLSKRYDKCFSCRFGRGYWCQWALRPLCLDASTIWFRLSDRHLARQYYRQCLNGRFNGVVGV